MPEPKSPEDMVVEEAVTRAVAMLRKNVWGEDDRTIVLEILRVVGYWQLVADSRTALAAVRVAADTLSDVLAGSGLPRSEPRQVAAIGRLGSGPVLRERVERRETAGVFAALAESQERQRELKMEVERLHGDVRALSTAADKVDQALRTSSDRGLVMPARSPHDNIRSLVAEVVRLRGAVDRGK